MSSKINGFKVVGSVGKNQFFCSDNGSDTNTKYVKPSKTEGFAGDNGDVTTWYSATIASNIRVRVQNITLPTIGSKEYDGLAHGFGHTTYPNTANGAYVIVNYNGSVKAAEDTVSEIVAAGGKAEAMQCDVSDFEACGEMIKAIVEKHGHVDILVNNAGITRDGLLMKMSEEDFDRCDRQCNCA